MQVPTIYSGPSTKPEHCCDDFCAFKCECKRELCEYTDKIFSDYDIYSNTTIRVCGFCNAQNIDGGRVA